MIGFKLQAEILLQMIHSVETGRIVAPLFDPSTVASNMTNQQFLREYMVKLLSSSFETVNEQQVLRMH